MDDAIGALGVPYDPRAPRWITCHQGSRWCGWHRMSNSETQLVEIARERREHEEECRGGV